MNERYEEMDRAVEEWLANAPWLQAHESLRLMVRGIIDTERAKLNNGWQIVVHDREDSLVAHRDTIDRLTSELAEAQAKLVQQERLNEIQVERANRMLGQITAKTAECEQMREGRDYYRAHAIAVPARGGPEMAFGKACGRCGDDDGQVEKTRFGKQWLCTDCAYEEDERAKAREGGPEREVRLHLPWCAVLGCPKAGPCDCQCAVCGRDIDPVFGKCYDVNCKAKAREAGPKLVMGYHDNGKPSGFEAVEPSAPKPQPVEPAKVVAPARGGPERADHPMEPKLDDHYERLGELVEGSAKAHEDGRKCIHPPGCTFCGWCGFGLENVLVGDKERKIEPARGGPEMAFGKACGRCGDDDGQVEKTRFGKQWLCTDCTYEEDERAKAREEGPQLVEPANVEPCGYLCEHGYTDGCPKCRPVEPAKVEAPERVTVMYFNGPDGADLLPRLRSVRDRPGMIPVATPVDYVLASIHDATQAVLAQAEAERDRAVELLRSYYFQGCPYEAATKFLAAYDDAKKGGAK